MNDSSPPGHILARPRSLPAATPLPAPLRLAGTAAGALALHPPESPPQCPPKHSMYLPFPCFASTHDLATTQPSSRSASPALLAQPCQRIHHRLASPCSAPRLLLSFLIPIFPCVVACPSVRPRCPSQLAEQSFAPLVIARQDAPFANHCWAVSGLFPAHRLSRRPCLRADATTLLP